MPRTHDDREPHRDTGHEWALVLAAGEGSRLRSLTTTASGVSIPKQFCSLGGGVSLLHAAIRRAQNIAPPERICAVVAEQHRRWWQALPLDLPAHNLIPQPRNRGTANGILLPLLHILRRDPDAVLLVLPSDHYVQREDVLASSMHRAVSELARDPHRVILLGIAPEEPDPELGYIVAEGTDTGCIREVAEFIEKPSTAVARDLIARGGVWNSFIFAAHGRTLMSAFETSCPDLVGEMRAVLDSTDMKQRDARLAALYGHLPELDFSRDILQRRPSALRVLTVPPCGWSDLGTPRRVSDTVRRYESASNFCAHPPSGRAAFLDLAALPTQATALG
jgi:mannose-1-phosphate guanylyltransferase